MTASSDINNEPMELAWRFIAETDTSVFLTGKAGTGKTTFLRRLRELMPKRMAVLAPTGVAAINAQGQTIHSFFQLPLGPMVPGAKRKEEGHYRMSKDKKKLIRTLDLLVIDEISMVRCDVLDAVDEELRKYRDHGRPFGGVQLLLIGDLQQLPPVTRDHEWDLLQPYYQTPYFFGSKALQQLPYVTIELEHIYRQQDHDFIDLLAQIRSNRLDAHNLQRLNARYKPNFTPPDGEDWIRLTTHNRTAQQYNELRLNELNTPARNFRAEIRRNFPESSYPADEVLTLKKGAQVMFIKNDPTSAHEYYNGKIGIVHEFLEGTIVVYCKEDESYTAVPPLTWENTKYEIDPTTKEIREEVDGTFTQYPLRLAWAITVHKSQGLTFDRAVLDINAAFAHGQVYVALSRCRTLEGMVLTAPLHPTAVISDQSVNQYMSTVLTYSRQVASHLPELQKTYTIHLLDELFDFRPLQQAFDSLQRVAEEHLYKSHPDFLQLLRLQQPGIVAHLVNIGQRFQHEYRAIMASPEADSTTLNARISAAIHYFIPMMQSILGPVMMQSAVRIENKAISQRYNNALDTLTTTYQRYTGTMKRLTDKPFTVSAYLNAKAKALLDDGIEISTTAPVQKPKPKPRKAADAETNAKPKYKKGDTYLRTLALQQQGKSIPEIAAQRGLAESTIASHIARFIQSGEISIDQLVEPAHQALIRQAITSRKGSYSFTDIASVLPANVPPYCIRLVEATMK